MEGQSIMGRLVSSGVPIKKAAKVTVRCITNQNGLVKTQTETNNDQSK